MLQTKKQIVSSDSIVYLVVGILLQKDKLSSNRHEGSMIFPDSHTNHREPTQDKKTARPAATSMKRERETDRDRESER